MHEYVKKNNYFIDRSGISQYNRSRTSGEIHHIPPTLSQRDAPLPVQLTHSSKNMATLHANAGGPGVALAYARTKYIFLADFYLSYINDITKG